MALTLEALQQAGQLVAGASTLREAAAQWRSRYPDLRVVLVDAMDLRGETPALELGPRRIYLASSNGHCWHVTQAPQDATALILTQDE